MRLPGGLREQPAWVFIGTLTMLAGLSYMFGLAESVSLSRVLDEWWIRMWGGVLFASGALVVTATWIRSMPLERFSLRALSLSLLVYMGWILTALPLNRAVLLVVLCLALIGLAEIRVAVLRMAMRPLPPGLGQSDEEDRR